ncbi:MAG: glycoside hydrolase family 127 protein [Clostridia bacterium]|nr:glycoside hydrolase family 127 protein [Clostridia bacterium]
MSHIRPMASEVKITDAFWSEYLQKVRKIMLPYVFDKFEEVGYLSNFAAIADSTGEKHKGPPFSDGLFYEAMRGAYDFLASYPDEAMEKRLDQYAELIARAGETNDGFLCTQTMQDYPDRRFGEGEGDIVIQHDLYDQGALVEAAVSQYLATGKTVLLHTAVRSANLIVSLIGPLPKKNIVPGHSLPEEAYVKLYRLFRDHGELADFAKEHHVRKEAYLETASFWYTARGDHRERVLSSVLPPYYNQDHLPFFKQREAVGHAVRALLCYTGAAAAAKETGDPRYKKSLDALWHSVTRKKLHINGGVGTRHDIEGFDDDYSLTNSAYLETCASIALSFFAGEMHLLDAKGDYFDIFEKTLYNVILASISDDFTKYFYQNPQVSSGNIHRWSWHGCPCCPPMLLKLFSALSGYIYSADEDNLWVNLFIGSEWQTDRFRVEMSEEKIIRLDSFGKELTLRIRIPDYAEGFRLLKNEKALSFRRENGYAVVTGVWSETDALRVHFKTIPHRMVADPRVNSDRGRVAFQVGPFVYCAEGIDNGGKVDFTVAEEPDLHFEGDRLIARGAKGEKITLIPYHLWNNRTPEDSPEAQMAVWFRQENKLPEEVIAGKMRGRLYADYDKMIK